MHMYGVRDVERVLRLPRSTVRSLINAGFVSPARGPRREYRFSFQDLIVLRAARALIDAKIPRRRISRSLEDLRKHLPEEAPLAGLSICAVGDRVVVREGDAHWQVDNGQYVLGLDVSVQNGVLRVMERKPEAERAPKSAEEDWFEKALALEGVDARGAERAYEKAVALDQTNCAAWINWGRLLHERGALANAERVYRRAIEHCERDPLLFFNLGVLLEDLQRIDEAVEAYQTAVEEDPSFADAHFNLARLYEAQGKEQHAIRHLGHYRRLMGPMKSG